MAEILHLLHNGVYVAIIGLAVYGVFCAVLLRRQFVRRQFKNDAEAEIFLNQFRDHLAAGDAEQAEELCSSPQFWYKAVPLLGRTIIEKRGQSIAKIRQALVGRFTRDILTGMESLIASINIVVKCEPMLGLLGTVMGMIGAFGRIATIESPSPKDLMEDLSVALNATALGLSTAIPMLLVANYFQVRLRKFEDRVFDDLQLVLDDVDANANERLVQPARTR